MLINELSNPEHLFLLQGKRLVGLFYFILLVSTPIPDKDRCFKAELAF